jgi:hypothetical protein
MYWVLLAFPHVPLSDPVFMRPPQGWHVDSSGKAL